MKPLLINPSLLRALPKELGGIACSVCDKTQAKWEFRTKDVAEPVCSWCVLYASPWGDRHSEEISSLVAEISVERQRNGRPAIAVDSRGVIRHCSDADALLSAVQLFSVAKLQTRTQRGQVHTRG